MIKSVTVTNYLERSIKITLKEDNPSHGLILKSIDGLGAPSSNINTTEVATNDGALFNSARATKRNVTLNFLFTYCPTIEDARHNTYRYFPIKRPVTLTFETDRRTVSLTGYVKSNEPDIFSDKEACTIQIVCTDPYFFTSEPDMTVFADEEPWFEFDFSNEDEEDEPLIEISRLIIDEEKEVFYMGEVDTGFIIILDFAPSDEAVEDIRIYNVYTGEILIIDTDKIKTIIGSEIEPYDSIIINTNVGKKSIKLLRKGKYYNILNAIGKGSNWFKMKYGSNKFLCTAKSGQLGMNITIKVHNLYEGV